MPVGNNTTDRHFINLLNMQIKESELETSEGKVVGVTLLEPFKTRCNKRVCFAMQHCEHHANKEECWRIYESYMDTKERRSNDES